MNKFDATIFASVQAQKLSNRMSEALFNITRPLEGMLLVGMTWRAVQFGITGLVHLGYEPRDLVQSVAILCNNILQNENSQQIIQEALKRNEAAKAKGLLQ